MSLPPKPPIPDNIHLPGYFERMQERAREAFAREQSFGDEALSGNRMNALRFQALCNRTGSVQVQAARDVLREARAETEVQKFLLLVMRECLCRARSGDVGPDPEKDS